MKILAKHVAAQLEERPFCVVFESDLERCWPSKNMAQATRKSGIRRFAESRGWNATVLEGEFGIRAIFERLEPDPL